MILILLLTLVWACGGAAGAWLAAKTLLRPENPFQAAAADGDRPRSSEGE